MGLFDSLKSMFGGSTPAQAANTYAASTTTQHEASSTDEDSSDTELEERDDCANFDLERDLGGYFAAEFHIERAADDEAKLAQLFAKYGIRNLQHFQQVRETVRRYIASPQAQRKYGGTGEIMHLAGNVKQQILQAEYAAAANTSDLQPFEGIALEQWAAVQAQIAGGANYLDVIRGLGLDQVKWDRINAEWNARMARDTTFTIATAYGNAFTKNTGGQFAGAASGDGAAPISLEKWVEIQEAQNSAARHGKDATQILASFGLSVVDWSNVSGWWSKHFNDNAMKNDAKLYNEYIALQKRYEAKYASYSPDADIRF